MRTNDANDKKQTKAQVKRVFNLIIVDESGSMSIIRRQAFTGMNETLQTVRQMQQKFPDQEQRVTLVTFDTGHTTWHYDNQPASHTRDLSWKAYCPGGGTPLYDAMGAAISKVNAQISDGDNVLGTFTLIGTDNLDVEAMADSFAIDERLEFQQTESGTREMFARERRSRARFNCHIAADIPMPTGSFFDEEN